MKHLLYLILLSLIFSACENRPREKVAFKEFYIRQLEKDNNISYEKIINTQGAYITSMCYTKTQDEKSKRTFNPCYACHTKGKVPNYYNDTNLQESYNFPPTMMKNPFSNLFKDRTKEIAKISDQAIRSYVKESNYMDSSGKIILDKILPSSWKGYRPDCYYNFDKEGFDRDPEGDFTLWRAFRYYPFLGTFWPTNGSTDDVLIRLDRRFSSNDKGVFDKEIYKLNLAIVEAIVKQKDILLYKSVDERRYSVDLNQNGRLDRADKIVFVDRNFSKLSYVGEAKEALEAGELHLAGGVFPENTEFLHSVRYLYWDEGKQGVRLSARMKELRYAKKYAWSSYSQIDRIAKAELWESNANDETQGVMAFYRGNYEEGLKNGLSWIYQGFIEDKKGDLRPQTHEETISCMGCHAHLGVTIDSTFAFGRKFEGTQADLKEYGWNHWSQKGFQNIKEPVAHYIAQGKQNEYSFYLKNNHSGNEFRNNSEVEEKFFHKDGSVKKEVLKKLKDDISLLLLPSKKRALELNKAYRVLVKEQRFIYGRDANAQPMKNVYKEINMDQSTGIKELIVQ